MPRCLCLSRAPLPVGLFAGEKVQQRGTSTDVARLANTSFNAPETLHHQVRIVVVVVFVAHADGLFIERPNPSFVETYIKGYYEEDIDAWAKQHPEYTPRQVAALKDLKKKTWF